MQYNMCFQNFQCNHSYIFLLESSWELRTVSRRRRFTRFVNDGSKFHPESFEINWYLESILIKHESPCFGHCFLSVWHPRSLSCYKTWILSLTFKYLSRINNPDQICFVYGYSYVTWSAFVIMVWNPVECHKMIVVWVNNKLTASSTAMVKVYTNLLQVLISAFPITVCHI